MAHEERRRIVTSQCFLHTQRRFSIIEITPVNLTFTGARMQAVGVASPCRSC